MKNAGQMYRPDLEVTVLRVAPSRIDGRTAGDGLGNALIRAGADVIVFLNPPGTAFRNPEIVGNGRVREDRIEIDLVLPPARMTALTAALEDGGRLLFQTRAITETLFRVEAVAAG